MLKIINYIVAFIDNITSSFIKLLILLILSVLFVFLIGICICFLSESLFLHVSQFEIILTFVGIIGTFIVVTNFQQVHESKELAKKEIEEIKQKTTEEIHLITQQNNLIKEFVIESKEYIVAKKIVEQQRLPLEKKEIWYLEVMQYQEGLGKGFKTHEVKIELVSLDIHDALIWNFLDTNNEKLNICNCILSTIRLETLEIDDLECRFDNQSFRNWLKVLLKSQ